MNENRWWGVGGGGWGKVRPYGPACSKKNDASVTSRLAPPPRAKRASGNALMEFAVLYGGVILPLTFMLVSVRPELVDPAQILEMILRTERDAYVKAG